MACTTATNESNDFTRLEAAGRKTREPRRLTRSGSILRNEDFVAESQVLRRLFATICFNFELLLFCLQNRQSHARPPFCNESRSYLFRYLSPTSTNCCFSVVITC